MGRLAAILLLCSMVIAIMPMVQGVDESPEAVAQWFKNVARRKQKVTKLHFYYHDQVSGPTPTAVGVAQANSTSQSPTRFGRLVMMDDALTAGPEPNSPVVGRGQGIYGLADQKEVSLLMTLNFYFTSGPYNGSTLSVLGRNPIYNTYRELPIVGGSGVFRMARGIATAKTYSFDIAADDAVVEYNVIVLHY